MTSCRYVTVAPEGVANVTARSASLAPVGTRGGAPPTGDAPRTRTRPSIRQSTVTRSSAGRR